MLATEKGGELLCIPRAQIFIPRLNGGRGHTVNLRILPEVTDSKSADYPGENITGRSSPVPVYSHSGMRQITWKCHFAVTASDDIERNYRDLRALQSAVYPDDEGLRGVPYIPPPICKVRLGQLLNRDDLGAAQALGCNGKPSKGNEWVAVVLRQCSVSFPTDVMWDADTYLPYKFDVDLNWDVIYTNTALPGQQKIFRG